MPLATRLHFRNDDAWRSMIATALACNCVRERDVQYGHGYVGLLSSRIRFGPSWTEMVKKQDKSWKNQQIARHIRATTVFDVGFR